MLLTLIPLGIILLALKYPLSFSIEKRDRQETSDYA